MNVSEEKWLLLYKNIIKILTKVSSLSGYSKHKSILNLLLEKYYLGDRSLELYLLIKDYLFVFNQAISLKTKKERSESRFSIDMINISIN